MTAERYAEAEQLLIGHGPELIVGGEISPGFISGTDRFWFLDRSSDGHQFVLVEPDSGIKQPAFDHDALAASLSMASGQLCLAGRLPFGHIQFVDEGAFFFAALGRQWRYEEGRCEDIGDAAEWITWGVSPDGRWAVTREGFDVGLIEIATRTRRRLTTDGTVDRHYGSHIASWNFRIDRAGGYWRQPVVLWSPDSSRFALELMDETDVDRGYLIETTESHPRLHVFPFSLPEDTAVPLSTFFVVSVGDGHVQGVDLEPVPAVLESQLALGNAWWSSDGKRLEIVAHDRYCREARLIGVDPDSGAIETIVDERADTLVSPADGWDRPCARILSDARGLWYSRRDGWGHLWLVDGERWSQLTSGEWVVREVAHVDEPGETVYFTASGLEPGRHPYHRYLYRVPLGGGEVVLLTPEDADHQVTFTPSGEAFVDCYSSNVIPPASILRARDGNEILSLGEANVSKLHASAWTEPVPFSVKAADGVTDVYGVLYPPRDADDHAPVPVVDCVYPGPMKGASQFRYGLTMRHCEALAALGFAAVTIEGRGTPYRSPAFTSASYGRMDFEAHLADQVAAIKQLAERYPWIDLGRVGIAGVSGGGYLTVRALLTHPGFFKVGVAIAGDHDRRRLSGWAEPYLGPTSEDVAAWDRQSNFPLAGELRGKLLLAWGCMDNNVPPYASLAMLQAFIDANKDVDLVVLPNEDHFSYMSEPYFVRRMWDYLVQHLRCEVPPEYRISEQSLMRIF